MYCLGPGADDKDSDLVNSLFSSVGLCRRVAESQIGERVRASRWEEEEEIVLSFSLLRRGDRSVRERPRLHVSHTGGHG